MINSVFIFAISFSAIVKSIQNLTSNFKFICYFKFKLKKLNANFQIKKVFQETSNDTDEHEHEHHNHYIGHINVGYSYIHEYQKFYLIKYAGHITLSFDLFIAILMIGNLSIFLQPENLQNHSTKKTCT